jgi:hypothetical protein
VFLHLAMFRDQRVKTVPSDLRPTATGRHKYMAVDPNLLALRNLLRPKRIKELLSSSGSCKPKLGC